MTQNIEKARAEIFKIANELLTGDWLSPYQEDNPASTTQKMLKNIGKDCAHRARIANNLKDICDEYLGRSV
jgi:hypothetical protein